MPETTDTITVEITDAEGTVRYAVERSRLVPFQARALETIRRAARSLAVDTTELCECGHHAGSHDHTRGFCRVPAPGGRKIGPCGCKAFTPTKPTP